MCFNCGCGAPDDDHGDPRRITNRTFERAAQAVQQSARDARQHTRDLLDAVDPQTGERS